MWGQCGDVAKVNPSKRLVATGGRSVNDVAVYRLPDMSPVCLGTGGHEDWLFDLLWLGDEDDGDDWEDDDEGADDEYVVSGGRDSRLGLWRVRDHAVHEDVVSCGRIRWRKVTNHRPYRSHLDNETRIGTFWTC